MDAREKTDDAGAVRDHAVRVSPAEVADRMFHTSSHPSFRELECSFRDGVLTLGGRVPSYYLKQLAQTAAQDIEGVQRVDNQILVSS